MRKLTSRACHQHPSIIIHSNHPITSCHQPSSHSDHAIPSLHSVNQDPIQIMASTMRSTIMYHPPIRIIPCDFTIPNSTIVSHFATHYSKSDESLALCDSTIPKATRISHFATATRVSIFTHREHRENSAHNSDDAPRGSAIFEASGDSRQPCRALNHVKYQCI